MPKTRKGRTFGRRHSDSDIQAGPWTDSSGSASEDEAARGFIDDVTADLARVNPSNGIVMGLPWEAPLSYKSPAPNKTKKKNESKKRDAKKKEKEKKASRTKRRSVEGERAHKHHRTERDKKAKKQSKPLGGPSSANRVSLSSDALRGWSRHFETEGREAERVLGAVECGEWLRRYRAWLVEWSVASGDCRRALRNARDNEIDITLRGLRSAYVARAAGADALRALLTSTTPAQRRDPNWVRVHHFGGAYVASTERLGAWIATTGCAMP